MPTGLRRFHASGQRHFITCSCYRRQPLLGSVRRRDLLLKILDEVRQQYDFVVWVQRSKIIMVWLQVWP
jgi:REP element-mobilizing transposase RayT